MLRIVALNEKENEEDSEDEIAVTTEAQETIAETEYMRAMKFKYSGKSDLAVSLLKELLETKVLNELSGVDKNEKLWLIRYNCHKMIAIISQENGEYEIAIQHYIWAIQMDDSDVYTMQRFGYLALKLNALETAEFAFEKCLRRNPLHYGAAHGKLKALCLNQNILGAYGWSLKLYRRDPSYQPAKATMLEISENLKNMMPLLERIWGQFPEELKQENLVGGNVRSAFQTCVRQENTATQSSSNLDEFRMKEQNWLSVGQYIVSVYKHLEKNGADMLFVLSFEDITTDTNCIINEEQPVQKISNISNAKSGDIKDTGTENVDDIRSDDAKVESNSHVQDSDTALSLAEQERSRGFMENLNIDSESNTKAECNDAHKPKARRRSDLHFLEQWGWHKTRRSTSRKKPQQERIEADHSLNGILTRIFSKFKSTFFNKEWPFSDLTESNNANGCQGSLKEEDNNIFSNVTFEVDATADFNTFIQKLKANRFDLMELIYKWLKYLSLLWNKKFPDDLGNLYLDVFKLYSKHFDFATWNQLSCKNLEASYRICLLYLELEYRLNQDKNWEITFWEYIFHQLTYMSGSVFVVLGETFANFELRLINLEYVWHLFCNRLEDSVTCLKHMGSKISKQPGGFALNVPNLNNESITEQFVTNACLQLQRKIGLNDVPVLFIKEEWSELIRIISNNIRHSKETDACEIYVRDFKVQIEVLLQSLWNLGAYEDCLRWSEKCLHFCIHQYLKEFKNSQQPQNTWTDTLNYIYSYIEALILNESYDIVDCLNGTLERLVQNLILILTQQLDGSSDKNIGLHDAKIKEPWLILHQIMLREENNGCVPIIKNADPEDDGDNIPNSFLILFTAHEFLGRKHCCTKDNGAFLLYVLDSITPNLKAPLYDACRDSANEYIEQVTHCLYGYPQKKPRNRYLEDHESTQIEMTWPRAVQLFDLYRPESLPEFNSYKLESITSEMEQMLLKIIGLMPKELDPTPSVRLVTDYINGKADRDLEEETCAKLPFKISCIFYLLADYYFKNRDFSKATKYYIFDLACNHTRFDSWAGLTLSKASKIDTKLNGLTSLCLSTLLSETENTIRCFERCISLNSNQALLWIEYGSFTYTIHSYCSRYLKHSSENLSMEQFSFAESKKEKMLNKAFECFTKADALQKTTKDSSDENGECHEEKWLCQYMLGKIAEKRKEKPQTFLMYYLTAAHYLYENNATYPIKINHSSPTTLSVEALEVFYRTNSAIIKYLEHEKNISRENGNLFNNVLTQLSNSAFAFNNAKIDGNSINALKRKLADKTDPAALPKMPKVITSGSNSSTQLTLDIMTTSESYSTSKTVSHEAKMGDIKISSSVTSSRRESQESGVTATTTTVTSSATSSSSSSDSSSSDSDSDSDSSSIGNASKQNEENRAYSVAELDLIYSAIVRNLEECVTRFPEHYKSIYRLVYHFMNAPSHLSDLNKCEQLLLGQYKTCLGNQISGLFFDRKNNNLFNGIWRIPSSEIDRPGSFSSHLVKCVSLLIQVLLKTNNHKVLIDVGLQLYKTPDPEKQYIKDAERIELYQQCITYSAQIMRNILMKNMKNRNDMEIVSTLIEIYKIHKKCIKYLNQKEQLFTQLLIDVYKFYIQDKVDYIPESLNFVDLAIKLCVQEISFRKNLEKANNAASLQGTHTDCSNSGLNTVPSVLQTRRTIQIPGLPLKSRGRPAASKTHVGTNVLATPSPEYNTPGPSATTCMRNNLSDAAVIAFSDKGPMEFQQLFAELYEKLLKSGRNMPLSSRVPPETTITPAHCQVDKTLKFFEPSANIAADELKRSAAPTSTNQLEAGTAQLKSIRSPSIFVTPLANLQAIKSPNLTQDLSGKTHSVTITSNPVKFEGKAKSSMKNKPLTTNAYQVDFCDMQNSPVCQSYLNKNLLQQPHILYQKELAELKRKSKIAEASNLNPSGVTSALIFSTENQKDALGTASHHMPAKSPFNLAAFESESITVTTLPSSTAGTSSPAPVSQYFSSCSTTPSVHALPKFTVNTAPTKTLQQKLAERQKANQINDNKASAQTGSHANMKSNIDIIILD